MALVFFFWVSKYPVAKPLSIAVDTRPTYWAHLTYALDTSFRWHIPQAN